MTKFQLNTSLHNSDIIPLHKSSKTAVCIRMYCTTLILPLSHSSGVDRLDCVDSYESMKYLWVKIESNESTKLVTLFWLSTRTTKKERPTESTVQCNRGYYSLKKIFYSNLQLHLEIT
eukprot:UN24896